MPGDTAKTLAVIWEDTSLGKVSPCPQGRSLCPHLIKLSALLSLTRLVSSYLCIHSPLSSFSPSGEPTSFHALTIHTKQLDLT